MEPQLLIASPQMKDPFFERTVVLVWHHDEDGAIGVVVNRPLSEASALGVMPEGVGISIGDVLVVEEGQELGEYASHPVNWGGPVDTDSGTLITTAPIEDGEGWVLPTGLAITRSHDALLRVVRDGASLRLCLGYAGWGPGQLDREIAEGSWLFTEARPDLVFGGEAADCWERAIATLGLTPEWVLMSPADA
ncbi:MAG: YqgE/AlgH family protein [Myxococcales bacterium]|nr:YqgE/AlgH family protein [Myxococcales bacterium]MCB9668170.1 YqgE/AlgH family protein [Alphaproteobacteria bacterium]MCB9692509.1 YqgE/AlgH family protein [Alphaproteobacteria bacterium]